jgi:type I restriction enzyme M protein
VSKSLEIQNIFDSLKGKVESFTSIVKFAFFYYLLAERKHITDITVNKLDSNYISEVCKIWLLNISSEFDNNEKVDKENLERIIQYYLENDIFKGLQNDEIIILNNSLFNLNINTLKIFINECFIMESSRKFYSDLDTPPEIIKLVQNIIISSKTNSLLDICCGSGSFLKESKNYNLISRTGIELEVERVFFARVKNYVNGIEDVNIINSSVFALNDSLKDLKYDSVFSHFPWAVQFKETKREIVGSSNCILPLEEKNTSDYFFINYVLKHLSTSGKAAVIIPSGGLINLKDLNSREFLIDKGLLETIIELPSKLYPNSGIKTYLLIISYGNDKVKFIDGSQAVSSKLRNINILDDDLLYDIYIGKINDKSVIKTNKEIIDNNYSLLPYSYLVSDVNESSNGVRLDEIAEVFSGWNVTGSELDSLFTETYDKDSNSMYIIQMADIMDGEIRNNGKLYNVSSKVKDKYKLSEGDILITTKTQLIRSAVVDEDCSSYLASGSIIVIRPNVELVLTNYLFLYLNSEGCQKTISSLQTGNYIPNLNLNCVRGLSIPIKSIEYQREISNKYDVLRKDLIESKNKIKNLKEEIDGLLLDGIE